MTKANVINNQEENAVLEERAMRFYIAGRNGTTGRVFLDLDGNKTQYNEYDTIVDLGKKGATGINALAVMNRTLEQIAGLKEKGIGFKEPVVIYTLGLVADNVTRGTFKYWLVTKARNNGDAIDPIELENWDTFTKLYQELFTDVIIKNISGARVPKNNKYPVSQQQRNDDKIVSMLWDKIPTSSIQEFDESKTDNLAVGDDVAPF